MSDLFIPFIAIEAILLLFLLYIHGVLNTKEMNLSKINEKIFEVTEKLSQLESEDAVLAVILKTAVDVTPSSKNGSILKLEGDEFVFKKVIGYDNSLYDMKFKKEETFLYSNNFNEAIIINDPLYFNKKNLNNDNMNILSKTESMQMTSTICTPIKVNSKLYGIMNVDCMIPNVRFGKEELKIVKMINQEMEKTLSLYKKRQLLKEVARYDELTGIYNRRGLMQQLESEMERTRRYKLNSYLVSFDIDNFKYYNDTFGHKVGDELLLSFAQKLKEGTRACDIEGRISGDEFIALFIEAGLHEVESILERLAKEGMNQEEQHRRFSFSYGIARFDYTRNLDEIFAEADINMYKRKKARNKQIPH